MHFMSVSMCVQGAAWADVGIILQAFRLSHWRGGFSNPEITNLFSLATWLDLGIPGLCLLRL